MDPITRLSYTRVDISQVILSISKAEDYIGIVNSNRVKWKPAVCKAVMNIVLKKMFCIQVY